MQPKANLTEHAFISVWTFGISEADFESLNAKNRDAAAYVADDSDGIINKKMYMGTFEAVHQLHCLVSVADLELFDPYLVGRTPALESQRCPPCS